ncbi:hypothetical protein AB0945_38310 [Streptomyces sp. NPDC005474]|uniref:hypothetical protein n=1 Tax=Streptomyces sp. NPDC005474 TaxID=3154878 RepID=UPI0034570763
MLIQYPAFRAWQAMQVRSNNSIVALIIGASLAKRAMALSARPFVKAGEVLTNVARAQNLNVTAKEAEQIFGKAAGDMAFLAIPQVVALQIELCVGTVVECQRFPPLVKPHPKGEPPGKWAVPLLAKAVRFGKDESTADHLMKFCVRLRNSIMHGAGKVDAPLVDEWNRLPRAAKGRWESLAGRPFTYSGIGTLPELGWPEVMAALAVTKESAHEINARLRDVLTREQWAQVIACDYRDGTPRGRRRFNSTSPGKTVTNEHGATHVGEERALRRLQAHAATYYRPLGMTPDELRTGRDAVR